MTPPPSAFRPKPLLVGLFLSLLVALYSTYAGLKVGGVYWPILTATLAAMGLLKAWGGATRQEVNVAATAASTGGLLAAGVLFTVPAAWLLGVPISAWEVSLIALVGGLLGVAFTVPLRVEMIERLELPFPDGTATARLIEAGDEGGGKIRRVLAAAGIAGVFALARDLAKLLPPVVNLDTLGLAAAKRFSLGTSISLVPLAGGFLIGPRFTGVWFLGGVISYLVVLPWLVASGRFAGKAEAVAGLTQPLGIGVIVGASLAFFFAKGLPSFVPMFGRLAQQSTRRGLWALIGLGLVATLLSSVFELPGWLAVLAVFAAFMVAVIAARIAGELNIDPMEIFAIAVLLLVLFFVRLEPKPAVIFAAVLAIAAGMAGDFLQDLKAGHLVGTNPTDQLKAQLVSVVTSALVLGVVLTALHTTYGIGTVNLPAPQAVALAGIVKSGTLTGPLLWGGVAGAGLCLISLFTGQGILPIALGIGLYAPIELSLPLFAGGLLRAWADRSESTEPGRLLAAGAIGGEGLVGAGLALAEMFAKRL